MNTPWAISLAREDAAALGPLRLQQGLEVGETERLLWLRGKVANENLERALLRLPATGRYEWLPDNRLRHMESRIPSATLPVLQWTPLSQWLRAEPGAAALPATTPDSVPLQIVRSSDEHATELLLTDFNEWRRFVMEAPEVRLRALSFALNGDGQVAVRGMPLPPLPGQQFVLWRGSAEFRLRGIALPAGFKWSPEVGAEVLLRRLGIPPDCIALWYLDGHFTRIHADQFVPASRSAVRASEATAQAFPRNAR